MAHYLSVAKEEGISDEEIGAAMAIVMAVSAGRVNAQFSDVLGSTRDEGAAHTCSGP